MIVGQGPTVLAVDADGVVWTFFVSSDISLFFFPLSGSQSGIDGNTVSKVVNPKTTNQPNPEKTCEDGLAKSVFSKVLFKLQNTEFEME